MVRTVEIKEMLLLVHGLADCRSVPGGSIAKLLSLTKNRRVRLEEVMLRG